jgi:hypothetical protein
MKMYGPYTRKDGRKHLCILHGDGRRQTLSYPRYLMQVHLGRELLPHEHIDHINNNKLDNRIENLQILTRSENAKKHWIGVQRKTYEFICPCCGKTAVKYLNEVASNRKKGKKGPYCSRTCAGKHTYTRLAGSIPASGTKGQT